MATLSRELSKHYADQNDVTIEKLLTSIFVFHECGENIGHPYLELHSDGSGRVIEPRTNREILHFRNLKEMVSYADDLIERHNIRWEED